jgi:hypothetical protein
MNIVGQYILEHIMVISWPEIFPGVDITMYHKPRSNQIHHKNITLFKYLEIIGLLGSWEAIMHM